MSKYASYYIGIGLLFVGLLIFNGYFFRGGKKYLGVTYAKEYKVTSDKSATVKSVHVVPGQSIKKGDLLVELTNDEALIEINKLQNRISAAVSDRDSKSALVQNKLDYLKTQKQLRVKEINDDLAELQIDLANKSKLLTSLGEKLDSTEFLVKIRSLEARKNLEIKSSNLKISDLSNDHDVEIQTLNTKLELLEKELELLLNEQKKLNKYAVFDGVIANVYIKPSELVPAFANLVSINPANPTSVVGYLSTNKNGSSEIGSKVSVALYDKRSIQCRGTIIGLGAVTELPDILQKSTAVKAYGQEVFVQLEENNQFTVGEKVVIE